MTPEQDIKRLNSELKALKKENDKLRKSRDEIHRINLTIALLDVYRNMMGNKPLPPVQIIIKAISDYVSGILSKKVISEEEREGFRNKLEYVASVLRYYYCLVHPNLLYDNPLKTFEDEGALMLNQLLDNALNEFSGTSRKYGA